MNRFSLYPNYLRKRGRRGGGKGKGVFIQAGCLFDTMAWRVGANLGRVLIRAQPFFDENWYMT